MDEMDQALLALGRALQDGFYHFTTPTPATHAVVNARPGNAWAKTVADVFGWSRPFRPGVLPDAMLALAQAAGAVVRAGDSWRATVRFSSLDGLLLAHSAYPTTEANAVFLGPDTYRFAGAIQALPVSTVRRAIDIGAGAGPGALLLARAYPDAEVFAVDINPAALRLTRINAALAGVTVHAVQSDLLSNVPGQFGLIVSNPPYLVDPDERAYRHGGGPLGAELSLAIVRAAWERLAPGGTLLLYTGVAIVGGHDAFQHAARAIVPPGAVVTYRELDPDVFGEELTLGAYVTADRIAAVAMTVRKAESSHA